MKSQINKIFVAKYFILLLIIVGLFGGLLYLRSKSQAPLLQRNFTTMGTFLTISVYPQEPATERAISAAYQEIERINKVFSTYREDSLTSRLRKARGETVEITPEFYKLLERAQKIYHQTDGKFDITVGPLVDLWGFYRENQQLPEPDQIDAKKQLVGFDQINFSDSHARLGMPGMRLDFGALAKGYAVDRAAAILVEQGLENFLINLGGNIYAAGQSPDNQPWRIGVQNPRAEKIDGIVELSNSGVGTSGDYERTFIHEGQRYSHIIDPMTGYPLQGVAATTVVAEDALTADILSTALYLTGDTRGWKNLDANKFMLVRTENGELNYYSTESFQNLFIEKDVDFNFKTVQLIK